MRALSGYLVSLARRLKAKWAAARTKRRTTRVRKAPPV